MPSCARAKGTFGVSHPRQPTRYAQRVNAARELARILQSWSFAPGGTSVATLHGVAGDEGWREHVEAMGLAAQVNRILDVMEQTTNVGHYRRAEIEWVKGLIVPETVWSAVQTYSVQVVPITAIDQLSALADLIDRDAERYQLSGSSRVQSIEALDEIATLLNNPESPELSPSATRYVLELIGSIKALLDEANGFDSLDLARRINELIGFLTSLADDLDQDNKPEVAGKLRDLAKKVRPFVIRGSLLSAAVIETAANIKALMQ